MKHLNIPVITRALERIRQVEHLKGIKGVKIKTLAIRSKQRLGCYIYKTRTIEIYPKNHGTQQDYIDTLLHELAHHVVAHYRELHPHLHFTAHGSKWREVARYLGANDRATQALNKLTLPYYLKDLYDTSNSNTY